MNRRIKQLGLALICGAQALMYQNCSDARFTNVENQKLGSLSCQTNIVDSTRTVKIMLVIDASGSNVDGAGTDPQKKWRLEAINSLVNRYGGKNNIHFGLATFQENSAKALIKNSAGKGIFSNSQVEIQAGLTAFKNNVDAEGTPYKAALGIAKSLIQQDIQNGADKDAVYSVIMVSDGMPSDYKNSNDVIPDAAAITSLAEGRVNINSVFYYNTADQKASIDTSFLKTIATVGKGTFATANSNESINLDDTIKVPQEVCY